MSTKGRLLRLFSGFLKEGEITALKQLSPAFCWVRLKTNSGPAGWQPGDKVQLLFASNDVRTYSPVTWGADGSTTLLVYLQADTPASRWARQLAVGQRVHCAGPQRSLTLPSGAIALIGDETSLGVAASYAQTRPGQVRCIFEFDANAPVDAALAELGLSDALVIRREPGTPRGVALAANLPTLTCPVGITGGAELVKRARDAVRAQGGKDVKTKAYWVEGRVGLD